MRHFSLPLRPMVVLMVVGVLSVASFAFANATTFSASIPNIGDGSTAVAGYDVTSVSFTLNADPASLTASPWLSTSTPQGPAPCRLSSWLAVAPGTSAPT